MSDKKGKMYISLLSKIFNERIIVKPETKENKKNKILRIVSEENISVIFELSFLLMEIILDAENVKPKSIRNLKIPANDKEKLIIPYFPGPITLTK